MRNVYTCDTITSNGARRRDQSDDEPLVNRYWGNDFPYAQQSIMPRALRFNQNVINLMDHRVQMAWQFTGEVMSRPCTGGLRSGGGGGGRTSLSLATLPMQHPPSAGR